MREQLLDRMIAIYGYENPIVVQFAYLCETLADNEWNNKVLLIAVEANEANPWKN